MNRTLLVLLLALVFSCNKVKQAGTEAIDKTKEEVRETKRNVVSSVNRKADSVFPSYDSDMPDTESNRIRFQEMLQVAVTDDVKNIYCFGDFMGTDHKILIAFQCDTSTVHRIIKTKRMQLCETADQGLIFTGEFSWWNKEKIEKIRPYRKGKDFEYWEYLWFDKETSTAYYEEFSL